jgi:hypothetical protein
MAQIIPSTTGDIVLNQINNKLILFDRNLSTYAPYINEEIIDTSTGDVLYTIDQSTPPIAGKLQNLSLVPGFDNLGNPTRFDTIKGEFVFDADNGTIYNLYGLPINYLYFISDNFVAHPETIFNAGYNQIKLNSSEPNTQTKSFKQYIVTENSSTATTTVNKLYNPNNQEVTNSGIVTVSSGGSVSISSFRTEITVELDFDRTQLDDLIEGGWTAEIKIEFNGDFILYNIPFSSKRQISQP